MIKRLQSKSGMTLIETMIGLVMFAIVAAAAAAIMAPTLNAFFNANEMAEVNSMLDNISAELLSDLSDATEITVTHAVDPNGSDSVLITRGTGQIAVEYTVNDDGHLVRNGEPVMGDLFYRRKQVRVQYVYDEAIDPWTITVTVSLFRADGTSLMGTRDYVVKPLGLF